MSTVGVDLDQDELIFQRGRDFRWAFEFVNDSGVVTNFPAGSLYFEFETSPVTVWEFSISGSTASLKKEHTDVALIPSRTKWQLVFRHAGELAGGDPVARGVVRVQS